MITEIKQIHDRLLGHFGPAVILGLTEAGKGIMDPFITVAGPRVDRVLLFCRVEPELGFDFLQSITCLDTGETLTCVYHLFSYESLQTLVFKCETPRDAASLPSSVHAFPSANWYEREVFDLFGVTFTGHPDLRRLLMPEDWEGYPGRKDYREKPLYNGIPTTRENPLNLLADPGQGGAEE